MKMAHIFDDAKLTGRQALVALSLTDHAHMKEYKYSPIHVFTYGERNFFGVYESLVLKFVKMNPDGGDFYVWLQQQDLEVKFI